VEAGSPVYRRAGLFVAFSLLLYALTVTYGFVDYDDQSILLGQKKLFATESFVAGIVGIFTELPREEPLIVRDLSWLIDAHIFGFENPLGYHLTSIVLNAIACGLVFILMIRLTGRAWLSTAVATLFAVLPAHVEPVCWVMGRKDVLSSVFMLAAMLANDRFIRSRSWGAYAGTILLVGLAMLSKINAATFFAVLFLQAGLTPFLRGDRAPSAPFELGATLRTWLPWYLPHAALSFAVFFWYRGVLGEFGLFGRGPALLTAQHLGTLATHLPQVLVQYLRIVFAPVGIGMFYDFPAVGVPIDAASMVTGWILVAVVIGFGIFAAIRRRDLLFFWLAAALMIVPYLNLVYIGIWVANRYMYIIAFPVLAVVLWLIDDATADRPGRRRFATVAIAVYGVLLCAQTLRIQPAFEDNAALWTYETSIGAGSMLSRQALARVYVRRAEAAPDEEAKRVAVGAAAKTIAEGFAYVQALGAQPVPGYFSYQIDFTAKLHHYRGRVMELIGRPTEELLEPYQVAMKLAPGSRLHSFKLAETYYKLAIAKPEPARTELGRRSLQYFGTYAELSLRKQGTLPDLQRTLQANYIAVFGTLAGEIEALRKQLGI